MTSNKLPNLIIAGVNKAGTTSLHTYLSWHPDICASKIKETNYFVPLLYGKELEPITKYQEYFKDCSAQSKYIVESTPRYIYGREKVAKVIFHKLGMIKVIFMLRDPVGRLFSYYKHMKDNNEIPLSMTFGDYVSRGLKDLNEIRKTNGHDCIDVYAVNVYVRGLAQGFYADYLTSWDEIYKDSAKIFFFEEMKNDPVQFMHTVCEWLQIESGIYNTAHFAIENRRVDYKSRILHTLANAVNDTFEEFFRKHYRLKTMIRNTYYMINEKKVNKEYDDKETIDMLELLYKPYNKRLYDLLITRGLTDFPEWLKAI